jgi:hypothetical protein
MGSGQMEKSKGKAQKSKPAGFALCLLRFEF